MIKRTVFYLGVLLAFFLISVPVMLPFFHAGYFPTHDGEWAVVRLTDMFRTLRDLQFPARYSGELNFGYGYPLFNFAYPLPYYLGMIPYVFGAGFVNSIKIVFASSVFLSAFFMFLASKALWRNNWAGAISAILYVYFPYRMVDLYVRGSVGESLSFVLFPLLFYLAIKLINKPSPLLIAGIAVSVASLVTTHNIMTVLFLPAYLIITLIQASLKNKKTIKPFFISIILGFGLSAFFWIPALLEKGNILLSKIPIADRSLYFVNFKQLIIPNWGYGVPIDQNGFSYQLGIVHLAVFTIIILSLLFFLFKNREYFKDHSARITSVLVIITLVYIFLLFKPSEFLWRNIPLLSEINYPWISLGILGFLISLLSGFVFKQAIGKYITIIFAILSIIMILPYAKPQRYIDNQDSYYLTNSATTTSSSELMPLWVKQKPLQRAEKKVEIINGNGSISNLSYNSKQISFSINALSKVTLKINTIYYPGWEVRVDKVSVPISYANNQGLIEISVPSGDHVVRAILKETTLRLASDIITVVSLFMILLMVFSGNKYNSTAKYLD
jgi:hypothetical protein